jgi:hypothetical protein
MCPYAAVVLQTLPKWPSLTPPTAPWSAATSCAPASMASGSTSSSSPSAMTQRCAALLFRYASVWPSLVLPPIGLLRDWAPAACFLAPCFHKSSRCQGRQTYKQKLSVLLPLLMHISFLALQVLEQNYRLKLLYSPDYRNSDPKQAMRVRASASSVPGTSAPVPFQALSNPGSLLVSNCTSHRSAPGAPRPRVGLLSHQAIRTPAPAPASPPGLQGLPPTLSLPMFHGCPPTLSPSCPILAPLERGPSRAHTFCSALRIGTLRIFHFALPSKQDFKDRIRHYEEVYETIMDRSIHYIKLIDMVTGGNWCADVGGIRLHNVQIHGHARLL